MLCRAGCRASVPGRGIAPFGVLWLVLLVSIVLAAASVPARAEDAAASRLALVVGNSSYDNLPGLKNAASDAALIRKSLAKVGFDVQFVKDAGLDQFGKALDAFAARVKPGSVVVVYYVGHGVQVNGENYLVPVDARLKDAVDLPKVTMGAQTILDRLAEAGASTVIFILDACRDNPFVDAKSPNANADTIMPGLARISSQAAGTLIAFSTSPGSVAHDGAGDNGPYATALSEELTQPGLSIEQVFRETRARVVVMTGGDQVPWESSSLLQDIVLQPKPGGAVAIVPDACDLAAGHPSDPERVGPSVEYASLDPQIAIPACERAVKAHPDNMRFKALLARAFDKAGRGEEAAALNQVVMKGGYLDGYHNMGNLYRKGLGVEKDSRKAFALYKYAAERGHPEDQANVGYMYMLGDGVEKNYQQARVWLTKAAAQNWATAFDKLGLLYQNGWGVKKDPVKAFEEFGKGANLGNAPALVNYATCYRQGLGTEVDYKRAYDLFMQAARLGATAAYVNLGYLVQAGQGTRQDPIEAAFWFTLAARSGNADAQKQLTEMLGKFSESEKQDLDQRLDEWGRTRFG
jgi:TPR repeat protein